MNRSSDRDTVQGANAGTIAGQQQGNTETSPSGGADQFRGLAVWEAEMDEAATKVYRGLARQRSQAKMKLVRINRTIINSSLGLAQLSVLSQNLSAIYAEYSQFHSAVIAIVPDEALEEQEDEYAAFENMYNDVSIAVQELLLEAKSRAAPPTPQVVPAPHVVIQQQPLKVPIPTFDGSYAAWPKFKAIFQDLMANAGDSDAIKLYHLDQALVGEAVGVLDAKILTEGNYKQAWELLKDRYDNTRAIVETHYRGLLSLKPMSSATHRELRDLLNEATHHIESLRFLKQEVKGTAEHFFVFLIVSALDSSTRQSWEATQKKGELPKYEQTVAFLKSRCQVLENCETAIDTSSSHQAPKPKQAQPPPRIQPVKTYAAVSNTSQPERVCEICGGSHRNVQCSALTNLTAAQKSEKIRAAGLCYNCLRKGHRSKDCPSDKTCQKCQRWHHTLLHENVVPSQEERPNLSLSAELMATPPPVPDAPSQPTSVQKIVVPIEPSVSTTCSCHFARPTKTVLLLTAVVHVFDVKNKPHSCRVMLDSGSQVNFVTEEMANRLGLQKHPANVPITGINALQTLARDKVKMNIRSRDSSYHASLECLVTPQVTGTIPASKIDTTNWDIPHGIKLADPEFHTPANVDMLIGGELFFDILKTSRLNLGDGLLELRDTHLGWIMSGVMREARIANWFPQQSNLALVHNIEREAVSTDGKPAVIRKKHDDERTEKSPTMKRLDPVAVVNTAVISSQPKQLPLQPLTTMNPRTLRLDHSPDERSVAADVSIEPLKFLPRFRSTRLHERYNCRGCSPSGWDKRDNVSIQTLSWPIDGITGRVGLVPWPEEIQRTVAQYRTKRLANFIPVRTNGNGVHRVDDQAGPSLPLLRRRHPIVRPDRSPVLSCLVSRDSGKLLQTKRTYMTNTDPLQRCLPATSEVPPASYTELNVPHVVPFKMKISRPPWQQRLRLKGPYLRGWFPVSSSDPRGSEVQRIQLNDDDSVRDVVLSTLNRGEYVPTPVGSATTV